MKTKSAPFLTGLSALILSCANVATPALAQADGDDESGPINVLFIVDASYSMKEKLSGQMKMTAAKEVLQDALSRIPNSVNLGLRVFGQSYSNLADIDCRQTSLMVPIGQHNRAAIIRSIRQIEPYGMTPIMFSLRQAAEEDFRGVQGRKTVILITDGADTCGGDPCAYMQALRVRGIKMKVDVVGVDLAREKAAREQLKCISAISMGKYFEANSSQTLIEGIVNSVDTAISGKVIPKEAPKQESPAPSSEPPKVDPTPESK
ncbi:MAG TPA: VWA domain-containing protein [Drouetiella sp.]